MFEVDDQKELELCLQKITNETLGTANKVLVIIPTGSMLTSMKHHIRINQDVYFLILETMELLELYKVNNHDVKTIVGTYEIKRTRGQLQLQFQAAQSNWQEVRHFIRHCSGFS